MSVTDGDRERAQDIACDLWNDMGNANVVDIVGEQVPVHAVIDGWAEAIAAALAEERERVLAPFLALAAEFAQRAGSTMDHEAFCAWSDAEGMVLRAAGPGGQS